MPKTGEDLNFDTWKKKNAPEEDGSDYDLYAAFKDGLSRANDGHFTDKFKKPTHATFSNESIYSTPERPGGKWERAPNNRWTYEPPTWMVADPERKAKLIKELKDSPDASIKWPAAIAQETFFAKEHLIGTKPQATPGGIMDANREAGEALAMKDHQDKLMGLNQKKKERNPLTYGAGGSSDVPVIDPERERQIMAAKEAFEDQNLERMTMDLVRFITRGN